VAYPLPVHFEDGDEESDTFIVTISVSPHGTLALPSGSLCQRNTARNQLDCTGSRGALNDEFTGGIAYTTGLNEERSANYTVGWYEPNFPEQSIVTQKIKVNAVNDPPVLTGTLVVPSVLEGSQIEFPAVTTLKASDPDQADTESITFSFSKPGFQVSGVPTTTGLSINSVNAILSSGSIRVQPSSTHWCGNVQMFIQLTDQAKNSSNVVTIDLNVDAVADVPTLVTTLPQYPFTYGTAYL